MAAHHTMKNILLVFTGGTIGSQLDKGIIDTHSAAGFQLIQLFQQRYPEHEQIRFKTLQPLQILSENLHPQAWQTIIDAIVAEDLSRFDGIILTHGTDTLAFSAAVLGIFFNALKIPMLLVSSNLPLANPDANGLNNFICAVDYIRQQHQPGVFVPYQNPGQAMQVHIATRLNSCLPLSGDFISVQAKAYLHFEHGSFTLLNPLPVKQDTVVSLNNRFARILLIKPYPGLNYSHFNLDAVDVVLHDLYHSGTACAVEKWGQQHSLTGFAQNCQRRGIPLYLAPAVKSDAAYSSTGELLAQGVNMIWNTSLESAYAKLALAYTSFNNIEMIDEFLTQDIAWEHV